MSKFKKRHPALKHGAYSSTAVLPGENQAEFDELYQALIAEWAPTGVLQEHTVADIARLLAQTKSWERFSWLSLRESIVMQSNLNVLQQP